MKTRILLICNILFILSFIGFGQNIVENIYYNKELGGDVLIKKSIVKIEGNNSYRIFEIETPEEGDYFLSTWLMGVIKEDNYLDYELLINGEKINEKIKPEKSNWQKIELKDSKTKEQVTIKLLKGINTIAFMAEVPIIANVEFVRLSKTKEKADISDENYRNYINLIKEEIKERETNPVQYNDTLETLKDRLKTTLPNPEGNYYHQVDIVCPYTWFSNFNFVNNQTIKISTNATGGYEHVIEVFSYYYPNQYSWVKKSVSGQGNLNITIPYTGTYVVRLRAWRQTTQGLVDLEIRLQYGVYYYGDCPVSGMGARHPHETPTTYNYFTAKNYYSDPFLFIEDDSGIPGKIIAFNNNYSGSGDYYWGLNSRVKKDFSVRVGAGLISSFSSYLQGTCDLYLKCMNSNIAGTGDFPNLKSDDAIQSSPATCHPSEPGCDLDETYNCISWSGGITTYWEWPIALWSSYCELKYDPVHGYYCDPLPSFDNFYNSRGYTRTGAHAGNSTVDLWAKNGEYSHGSVRKPGNNHPHGYDWESKPGANVRTFHPREKIGGPNSLYGYITNYYKIDSKKSASALAGRTFNEALDAGLAIMDNIELSTKDKLLISDLKNDINEEDINQFEIKYNKWKNTWRNPEVIAYSNPRKYAESNEYKELIEFCKSKNKIFWPLLIEKLSEGDFFVINPIEDLTLEDNINLLKEVKKENKLKPFDLKGAYIERSPYINAIKYANKLLAVNNIQINGKTEKTGSLISFQIYPNPISSEASISLYLRNESILSITIFDICGRSVLEVCNDVILNTGNNTFKICTDNIEDGIYFVKLNINGQISVFKIIVNK